jgi:multicomponent Na+:H+ antiporter subunit E
MKEAKQNSHCSRAQGIVRRVALRLGIFSGLWLVLTGPGLESWILGVPAVSFAVGLSLYLAPSECYPLSPAGLLRFTLFFLSQSYLSGIDVMRRALSPGLRLNPGLVSYLTLLPPGAPRIFFLNTISLLPGTLSTDLQGDRVLVHTLDKDLPIWAALQKLEAIITLLFQVGKNKGESA